MKTCDLPADAVRGFVAGVLAPAEAAAVAGHLAACAGCRADADAWRVIAAAVRAEGEAAAAPLPSLGPVLEIIGREAAGDSVVGEPGGVDMSMPAAVAPVGVATRRVNGSRRWTGQAGLLGLLALVGLGGLVGLVALGSSRGGGREAADARRSDASGGIRATAVPRAALPALADSAPGAGAVRRPDPGLDSATTTAGAHLAVPADAAAGRRGSGASGRVAGVGWNEPALGMTARPGAAASAGSPPATAAVGRSSNEAPARRFVGTPSRTPTATPEVAGTQTAVPTATPIDATPTGLPTATPAGVWTPPAPPSPTADTGIVAGRVLGPDGQPRAEIPVRAWRVGAGLDDAVELIPGADGRFGMALPAGDWLIGVLSPVHQPVWWRGGAAGVAGCPLAAAPIALAPGQTVEGVDFMLARLPDQRVVGRVVDGAGRPAAGAMIVAAPPGGADVAAWGPVAFADADGRFALALEPGTYVVGAAEAWMRLPRVWWDGAAGIEDARPITIEPGVDAVADLALPGP